MKIRYIHIFGMALVCAFTLLSCEAIFTTSYAKPFARNTAALLKNKSTADLLAIAKKEAAQNPDLAKGVLNSLASKSESEIIALSPSEKKDILNLAVTAVVDTKALTSMLNNNNDDNMTIETILNAFDTSTNLGAVETILKNDPKELEPTTVALATAVLIADTVADVDEDKRDGLYEILGKDNPKEEQAYNDLNLAEQVRIDTITGAAQSLEGREEEISIPGLNIQDLLGVKK